MKKKIIIILSMIFLIMLSLNINVNANYLSDKTETVYNSKTGLESAKANTICQTEDGHIWIGQYGGLTKYDSKTFTVINEYKGLNITGVTALGASGNNLFIGTQNGLFQMNEYGVITKFETDHDSLSIKDIKVFNKTVFIASDKGLFRYKIGVDENLKSKSTRSCINVTPYDDDNCFYVLDDFTVWGTLSESSTYYSSDEYSIKTVFFNDEILYLGTTSGTLLKREKEGNGYKLSVIENYMGAINDIIFHDDMLFVATDKGLYTVDKENTATPLVNLEVKSMIQKVMFDYENNLWIASSSDGVSKISKKDLTNYFDSYNYHEDGINAIEKYENTLYVAGTNGLYIFNELNHESVRNTLGHKMDNIRIRDLEIYKGKLYVATYDTDEYDLVVYDFETDEVEYIGAESLVSPDGELKKAKQIRCLVSSGDYLYIGTNDGISRYDGTTFYNKKLFKRPLYMYYSEADQRIYMALEDNGINYTDIDLNDVYDISDKLNTALKCLYVNDGLLFNDNNKLYFYKDGKISNIDYEFKGSITEILFLNNKYIIGTDSCIYITDDVFDKNSKYNILDNSNGLDGNLMANSSGYYNSENNTYYFTATNGVYVYDLSNTKTIKQPRRISIEGIYADDKLVNNKIKLSKNTNRLSIQFSVLSFINDKHYNVYYKLDGVDSDYRVMSSDEKYKIEYTNIKGGKYKLTIYTVDNDGTLSYNTLNINIVKEKKIHEHIWFWIIMIMLGIALAVTVNFVIIHIKNVKSKQRENELKEITIESIEAIARTIDAKDSYTNGHSIRVGRYSREIARALGLPDAEIENIYYIALLHDIGKISIRIDILNKPGKLTPEEYEIMKSHTTAGGKILAGISTIPHIVEGAMYHHEKYDGTGYPKGLKGEEIPYVARIICCADSYDAMATRRTYKEPYTKDKIISEFERCKGIQFDPKIADVVIELIKEDKLTAE